MSKISKAIEPKWLIVIVFFISGAFLGGLSLYILSGSFTTQGFTKLRSSNSTYKYINPLLGFEVLSTGPFSVNNSLELKIRGLLNTSIANNQISGGSIYFRDLESGYWAGVNEGAIFSPGKLLKIPLMIAYFKEAERDASILDQKITYSKLQKNTANLFPSEQPIVLGNTYSVNELVYHMIVHSDDVATNLLFDNIDKKALNEVFSDLGVNFREDKETTDYLPIKLFGLFFRILYNSTYLNRDFSEKALALIAESDQSVGIGASMPKEIPFLQRLGGRQYLAGNNTMYELYDCGIAYYPEHPYLLCASAKGKSINKLEQFFSTLSTTVYTEVDFKYKK